MFSKDVNATKCPIVAFDAIDQPLVDRLWLTGQAMYHALSVILLDQRISAFLSDNDPMALKQAQEALASAGV